MQQTKGNSKRKALIYRKKQKHFTGNKPKPSYNRYRKMKITLIRKEKESGTEALSICDTDTLFNRIKTETKSGHITALREALPALEGTYARYEHMRVKRVATYF